MLALSLAILAVAACAASGTPTAALHSALFYAKNGSIFVSAPAGTPGRKLTDGPSDTEPAPSPDGSRLAFIRKVSRDDYGGELWVLDLAADGTPAGAPRRLVNPADVVPTGGEPPKFGSPRWSPTGDRIAFLWATPTPAGSLLTAATDTGAVLVPQQPVWTDENYAWSPDGSHIAWAEGRSDVRAVAVSISAVGGPSVPVAEGTNASSVTYGDGGATVIFTNTDTTDPVMFPPDKNPFTLRDGGIYSVPAAGGAATPTPRFTGRGSYADVAVLADGALAFTECPSRGCGPRSIEVLAPGRSAPEKIAETPALAPAPAWSPDGTVAYVGASGDRPLLIMDRGDRTAKQVDVGIDTDPNWAEALAWALIGRR
jgi:Tol biopolymer transport system component